MKACRKPACLFQAERLDEYFNVAFVTGDLQPGNPKPRIRNITDKSQVDGLAASNCLEEVRQYSHYRSPIPDSRSVLINASQSIDRIFEGS